MQKIVNMDIQTILISIVICVVVAILVYLITVCSMREKSFEEVIAEQRRMQEQVLQKNRQQKKQRKEKFKKGKGGGKSSTDEADSNKEEIESEPVVAETHKMVELEIDPVIIEPTEMKKEHKKENKKNAKQPKPILHNKDEKPLVKETAEVEQFQPEHMPKDSVELKYSEKKKGKESKKEKAESKERVKEPAVKATEAAEPVKMVVEESIQVAVAAPTSASVKSGKKVKPPPEAVDTADGGISGTKLITMVRSATLSDKDIQHLIEILLNRQGTPVGSAGWKQISKGSDPVAQLKKQLEDKERAWQDEAKRAQEYSTSLRETQRQLSTERQKVALVEKQSHEQLEAKNQEIQAFHSRMQQSHEQHMHEVNSLTMKVKHLEGQMGQDHTAVIRRVQEENNQLKTQLAQFGSVDVSGLQQKVKIMEDEMNKNAMKISSADNIKKGLEAKVAHYEEQLRKYEASQRDSESVLSRKLNEVTEQLRKAEAQNNNLNRDLQGSRDSSRRMENDLANMKNKLQSMEQSRSDRENVLKTVEAKLKDSDTARKGLETKVTTFEHQLADKDKELQELKQANASLTVEVKTVQEVHSQQGAPAHNGPVDEGDKILRADHERLLAEKSTEVGKLSDDLSSKTAEIDKLRQEVDAQKKKNNELEAEKLKATSQVQTELKQLKQDLNTKVSEVEGLTTELETLRKQNNELQDSTSSQIQKSAEDFEKLNQDLKDRQAEVANLQKQLETQQNQNKDLQSQVGKLSSVSETTEVHVTQISSLNEEVNIKVTEITKLNQEIQSLKKENHELRAGCEKASAALTSAEKSAEDIAHVQAELSSKVTEVSKLQLIIQEREKENKELKERMEKTVENGQVSSGADEDHSREVLKRLFPDVKVKEEQSQEEWLQTFAIEVKKVVESSKTSPVENGDLARELQETRQSQSKLQSQVQHYKSVLADTEGILNKLQSSVETEEKHWKDKLEQVQSEKQKLEEEVKRLKSSEPLASIVEPRLTASESNIQSLRSQLSQTEEELYQPPATPEVEQLQTELTALEGEKKKLKSENVKLNGIIKTGQDALKAEQELVKELEQQLQDKSKECQLLADLTHSDWDIIHNEDGARPRRLSEAEELQTKLTTAYKQLEKEKAANKQLSKQLAASRGGKQVGNHH